MKTVAEFTFTNACELMSVLAGALETAKFLGSSSNTVLIVTGESGAYDKAPKLRLLEETLTDGSKAHSISIRA